MRTWTGTRSLSMRLSLANRSIPRLVSRRRKPSVVFNIMAGMLFRPPSPTCGVRYLSGCLGASEVFCWQPVLCASSSGKPTLPPRSSRFNVLFRKPLGEPAPQASNLALAVVLLIVLFIQAIFNAWQDFSTSRVMASIKGMLPSDVLVLRDSLSIKIPAKDLVPGDLITISMGEKVPADLRLIEVSADLQFERSI